MATISLVKLEQQLVQIIQDYTAGHLKVRRAQSQLYNRSQAVSQWCDAYAADVGREQADRVERAIRGRLLRYVEVLRAGDVNYRPGKWRGVAEVDVNSNREFKVNTSLVDGFPGA